MGTVKFTENLTILAELAKVSGLSVGPYLDRAVCSGRDFSVILLGLPPFAVPYRAVPSYNIEGISHESHHPVMCI